MRVTRVCVDAVIPHYYSSCMIQENMKNIKHVTIDHYYSPTGCPRCQVEHDQWIQKSAVMTFIFAGVRL